MDNFEINIYLASLEKYENGKDNGKWIELPCLNFKKELKEILENDEEWIILDAECDFLNIDEHEDIYKLNQLAFTLNNLKSYEIRALKSILEVEQDINNALNILKDKQYKMYDDVSDDYDMGEYLIDNAYFKFDKELEKYINIEDLGRDYAIKHSVKYTKMNTAIEMF